MLQQRMICRDRAPSQTIWIGTKAIHGLQHLAAFKDTAAAMHIRCQCDMAQLSEHGAMSTHIAAYPVGLMKDEHCAAICLSSGAEDFTVQFGIAIDIKERLARHRAVHPFISNISEAAD